MTDVSEMHRVESVRRDFVANVSHELKTPIGALEVLAETLVGRGRPGGRRDRSPSASSKEAERLARIVDDLLDLSLIETQEAPTARAGAARARSSTTRSTSCVRRPRRPGSTSRCTPASPARWWRAIAGRW